MTSKTSVRPADRVSALKARQTLKMAASAHAYVRGSTAKFYQWLDEQKRGTLPEGPAVWICGDCHVGNLGPVASADDRVAIQIRDFDQTVVGNPAHDIIRLALSLATASRGSDLPGVVTAHILEQVIEGYQNALRQDADGIDDAPKSIRLALKKSIGRSWKHLAKERLENRKPTIPLGSKFWKLARPERDAIGELFRSPKLIQLATSLRSRDDNAKVELVDAAYWMKGCSSLGLLRYAVLLGISSGKEYEFALIDVKEAVSAAAPRYAGRKMPKDQAERVVEGASSLSPHLGKRMASGKLMSKSVHSRIDATRPEGGDRNADRSRRHEGGELPGRGCRKSSRAPNGRSHAKRLVERASASAFENVGCPVMALVERRVVDRQPRDGLSRALPQICNAG